MPADTQARPSGGIREVRLHVTIPIEGLIVYQSFASLTLTCSKEKTFILLTKRFDPFQLWDHTLLCVLLHPSDICRYKCSPTPYKIAMLHVLIQGI